MCPTLSKPFLNSVLLVDDDEEDVILIQKALGSLADSIVVAKTIAQALSLLSEAVYDLVLLDVCLPDGISTEHVGDFYKINPCVDILLMSGVPTVRSVEGVVKPTHVPDFITKDRIHSLVDLITIRKEVAALKEALMDAAPMAQGEG